MRLHIGCGTVFLKDWLNIDMPGPRTFLAMERPDLVEKWSTTEDHYYAKHSASDVRTMALGPLDQEYVCDLYGDWENLPRVDIDEILGRHTWEHLSIREARRTLSRLMERMKDGATLRLDVPDHCCSLKRYRETTDPLEAAFYERHLLGPRRNDNGYHLVGYSRDFLRSMVEEYGFGFVMEEENIHCYPAFCLQFKRI